MSHFASRRKKFEDMDHSVLIEVLFEKMSRGMFFTDLRQIAHGAYFDGSTSERILGLASAGHFGQHAQNIERDVHTWLRNLFNTELEPYFITLDLDAPDSLGTEKVRQ